MIIVKFGCLIKEVTGNLVSIFFCNNFFNANSLPEPVTNNKIFLDDKIVGFLSALKNRNHLDAHFIGLNYSLNKTYGIYPRILNDYIRLGLEKKVKIINLGRTASEIKSTIGAKPLALSCYIKHKNKFLNVLIKPFFKKIQIKSFKQHSPFK